MSLDLLNPDVISKIILNTIFVSIPEEIFLVLFTLILMGEFNYWMEDECKKLFYSWDYPRILIPSILSALASNVLRYAGVNSNLLTLISISIMYFLIVFTNDIFNDANSLKWMGKALSSLLIGFMFLCITEIIYIPLILYGAEMNIIEMNTNVFFNFLVSIPARTLQYLILSYLIFKKVTLLNGNILTCILKNKFLGIVSLILLLFNTTFIIFINKLLINEKILLSIPCLSRLFFIIGICVFPVITLFLLLLNFYFIENRKIKFKNQTTMKLCEFKNQILYFKNTQKHKDTIWILNKLTSDIEEIQENICNKNNY